jgi:hypothetical protein
LAVIGTVLACETNASMLRATDQLHRDCAVRPPAVDRHRAKKPAMYATGMNQPSRTQATTDRSSEIRWTGRRQQTIRTTSWTRHTATHTPRGGPTDAFPCRTAECRGTLQLSDTFAGRERRAPPQKEEPPAWGTGGSWGERGWVCGCGKGTRAVAGRGYTAVAEGLVALTAYLCSWESSVELSAIIGICSRIDCTRQRGRLTEVRPLETIVR